MNPTDMEYHIVRILIITLSIKARETSIPSKVNNPIIKGAIPKSKESQCISFQKK